MTIKKRLFWSNIYMILVPVIAAVIVGLICIGFIWFALIHGVGLGIHDQDEFDLACEVIAEEVEEKIGTSGNFENIEALLNSNHIAMQIYKGTELIYSYGNIEKADEKLKTAADSLGGNVTVTQDGRAMHVY